MSALSHAIQSEEQLAAAEPIHVINGRTVMNRDVSGGGVIGGDENASAGWVKCNHRG